MVNMDFILILEGTELTFARQGFSVFQSYTKFHVSLISSINKYIQYYGTSRKQM
jgi:hypothetical protein